MPGSLAANSGEFCCPRCSGTLGSHSADNRTATATERNWRHDEPASPPQAAASGPPGYDDWELDEELRHIERVLASNRLRGGLAAADIPQETARTDSPHAGPPGWHVHPTAKPARQPAEPMPVKRGRALGLLIWTALTLGVTAFVGGGALLGWATVVGRRDLWFIGGPAALGGQMAMLLGLVLQLHRLARDSRRAAGKLDKLDGEIRQLRTTTTLLGTTHGPSAAAFYAHLADAASPQILLSDLKGQLDILAIKLGQQG